MPPLKSVFEFADYREFLKAYHQFRKEQTPGFTYQKFAQLAQLKSPNYLNLIIAGKRNLTISNIHGLGVAMELSGCDFEGFEALVLSNQSKNSSEAEYYRKKVDALKSKLPKRTGRARLPSVLSVWYFPAVYICLQDQDVSTAIPLAASKIGIPESKVKEIVDRLQADQWVDITDGKFRISFEHLVIHEKKNSNFVHKKFLDSQLKLSVNAFNEQYDRNGKFFAHTFSISTENYSKYVEMAHAFLSKITAECRDEPCEKLVQLNIQMFPLGHLDEQKQGIDSHPTGHVTKS